MKHKQKCKNMNNNKRRRIIHSS